MKRTDVHKLGQLQQNTANIRNICILAHVDHGKTTLADALLASNGIISQRLAGKLRYLDSREDEQQRGITMKSSAISLRYCQGTEEYLVNLIDSPGHIDFSSEVSTAVRLCDGAIVLVDVVEGVCPQTHAVLRQAWLESIRPVLVLNKIDRLVVELKMTTEEAYQHLQRILEQVNVITAELFTSDVLAKSSQSNDTNLKNDQISADQTFDWSSGLEDTDDSNLYFCPDQGNVVFASAVDGWGFKLDHFSELYARKLGLSETVLRETLWGDFYVDTKAKSVKKGAQAKNKKNLFVQLVLDNIWRVYDAVLFKKDKELIGKIVKSLELKAPPQNTESRAYLQSLFGQWLPLSQAVLAMVCELLPSPLQISSERVEKLLASRAHPFDTLLPATQQLKTDFMACSSAASAPVVIFVSKMFPLDLKALPRNRARPLTAEELASKRAAILERLAEKKALALSQPVVDRDSSSDRENGVRPMELLSNESAGNDCTQGCDQVFIAFARIFSGTVRRGQKIYVLGPKHDPAKLIRAKTDCLDDDLSGNLDTVNGLNANHIATVELEDLYMFMGRELEPLEEIPAGNILGIGGLEEYILKSAALSSTLMCPAYTDIHHEAAPIVRVAVYPRSLADMDNLVRGMKLLYQSDPCVEVLVQDSGEHVIVAAGEVHLQKCLDDLRTKYARIEIDHSAPIIPFRETIVPPPVTDMVNEAILEDASKQTESRSETLGFVEMSTANRQCSIQVRAVPLPPKVTQLLSENAALVKTVNRLSVAGTTADKLDILSRVGEHALAELQVFKIRLAEAFKSEECEIWADAVDHIWALSRNGTNILLNCCEDYSRPLLWRGLESLDSSEDQSFRDLDSAIISGFMMATQSGPLCEEPLMGVCFRIERWIFRENEQSRVIDCVDENVPSISSTSEGEVDVSEQVSDATGCQKVSSPVATNHQRFSDAAKQSQLAGQLMSCVKEGCRRAFQCQPQRLMWAMYTCFIQATADVLGKMYAVLGKRNGRVLSDEMREGSSIFNITAVLPVVESFGFAEEIRKRTSGLASPHLHFSHWEIIDVDPFWVPTTEEEYAHYGEKADSENVARKHMNAVRRRKGLLVSEKLVEFAEKQRTLKKNK